MVQQLLYCTGAVRDPSMVAEAWAAEPPPVAVAARLAAEAAALETELDKSYAQGKADLQHLKKELGCTWPLVRLAACALTLIIAGLVLSLLCVVIALLLCMASVILVLVAAIALLLAVACVLAACLGLVIAPPVLLLSTLTLSKLGRALSFAKKQLQADVARVAALLEWLEANEDVLLARAVSLARAATPIVKAKLQRFAGVAVSTAAQMRKVAPAEL
jgi:hypothetical protein